MTIECILSIIIVVVCIAFNTVHAATPETLKRPIVVNYSKASLEPSVCLKPKPFPNIDWIAEISTVTPPAPPFEYLHQALFLVCRAYQENLISAAKYQTTLQKQSKIVLRSISKIKIHQLKLATHQKTYQDDAWQQRSQFIKTTCSAALTLSKDNLEDVGPNIINYCTRLRLNKLK